MIVPGSVNPLLWGASDPIDNLGKIERSLRCRAAAGGHLSWTPATTSDTQKWTFRAQIKRGALSGVMGIFCAGTDNSANRTLVALDAADKLVYYQGNSILRTSARVLRDVAAFGDFQITVDQSAGIADDRIIFYWNGERVALTGTGDPGSTFMNRSGVPMKIGCRTFPSTTEIFDGYFSSVAFVDGVALGPEAFGQFHPTTGQWRPKSKTAIKSVVDAGGINSAFLTFDDTSSVSALCADSSIRGNNFTGNNISLTAGATYDSMIDTPTTDYCTLNPLARRRDVSVVAAFADGNLKSTHPSASGNATYALGTIGVKTGKYYWEHTATTKTTSLSFGIDDGTAPDASGNHSVLYLDNGQIYKYGSLVTTVATFATNDIISVALDVDGGTVGFYKNGTLQYTVTDLSYLPAIPFVQGNTNDVQVSNFGQRPYSYTPPDGFKSLCAKNLKYPKLTKSTNAFAAVAASGANIAATLAAARSGWSAYIDLIKRRESAEGWRWIFSDDPTYYLDSAAAAAKAAVPAFGGTSYVGYSLRVSAENGVATGRLTHVNGVADVVADGSGATRKMIILVSEGGSNWYVYHPELTAGKLLYLNLTSGETTDATISAVNSSGFTVAAALASGTYRWIALSEVGGIKLGSYTANASTTDGPFGHADGNPLLVAIKNIAGGSGMDFQINDQARALYNTHTATLSLNTTAAESGGADTGFDTVSNGFKIRGQRTATNQTNGQKHIFFSLPAFPFRYANAR